jgi:hypothetical protein
MFTWGFVLRPLDDGTTRIQVRWRNVPAPSFLLRIVVRLLVAPPHFVMMNQVLGGIKRRAERAEWQHEDIHGQSTPEKKEPGSWTARLEN